MDLTLTRKEKRSDGIFSDLKDADGNVIAECLEHAYDDGNGGWEPKIIDGTHPCVRGPHRLHGMTEDFVTFEITGIPGHSDLLFHWGNYNRDSEGCILVGQKIAVNEDGQMVTNSRVTWQKLMDLQDGVDTFSLTVE